VRSELLAAQGAHSMLRDAFLATDEAISAEEGCTATAVLMWRDDQGAVCLQASAALRPCQSPPCSSCRHATSKNKRGG
jgi:CMP-N-acetylneuraminic acid synthetase